LGFILLPDLQKALTMSLVNKLHFVIYRAANHLLLPWLALSLVHGAPAFAVQPGSYDVEIVVFSYRQPDDSGEQWPTLSSGETGFSGINSRNQISELPVDAYKLNGISNGLRQSGSYAVLFHRAWRQPAYDNADAVGYPVHATTANGRNSIEGSVRLIRERFLHLDAELLMLSGNTPQAAPVFELREKRRIKSNVVHYFDHPHFGMIATVTPYYSPAEAQQIQADSVKETAEETPVPPADDDQLTR
jgi:hypothetical protein